MPRASPMQAMVDAAQPGTGNDPAAAPAVDMGAAVQAAEACQVAIIHPGKPRDPNEPGLEELLARAEPFR